MRSSLGLLLSACLLCSTTAAQVGQRVPGPQVQVQNRSVNRNANVNVNRNVNVNVNGHVDVHNDYHDHGGHYHGGCYNCGYYHDDDNWNWGTFAAGAAVGVATTAIAASASHSSSKTVVVTAPAIGTIVPGLPAGCNTITANGTVIYNCSSIYYRPFYQGTALVYQVVTYP